MIEDSSCKPHPVHKEQVINWNTNGDKDRLKDKPCRHIGRASDKEPAYIRNDDIAAKVKKELPTGFRIQITMATMEKNSIWMQLTLK